MAILYANTRDASEKVTASQAILNGLAKHGGLYVPTEIPKLDIPVEELAKMSYQETAYAVMSRFLTDFTEEELKNCIDRAYDSKFDTPEIAPLVEADGAYYLELFHGATIAFKDMALSILPHLLITAARKNEVKEDIVILTATSGDTGKAALAGFADVEGTKIIVFYPKNGVSPIQEKQMVTQKGDNTFVVGIHGNFDEAQTGVKQMFSDPEMKAELLQAGYRFSCKLHQHRTPRSTDCLLCICICKNVCERQNRSRGTNQCGSSDRKLWKYFSSFLCKKYGTSDCKINLCL